MIPYTRNLETVLESVAKLNPGILYMLSGSSEIDNHVVLAMNDLIIWDPGTGNKHNLIGPCTDGFYWVNVLVRA